MKIAEAFFFFFNPSKLRMKVKSETLFKQVWGD